jgi:hypothetical protein
VAVRGDTVAQSLTTILVYLILNNGMAHAREYKRLRVFLTRRLWHHVESQKPKPTDAWSKELGGGTLTFTTAAVGNPIAGYVHEAKFERGTSSYSMTRQSTEPLTRAEVENRFADFISEIRHGQ